MVNVPIYSKQLTYKKGILGSQIAGGRRGMFGTMIFYFGFFTESFLSICHPCAFTPLGKLSGLLGASSSLVSWPGIPSPRSTTVSCQTLDTGMPATSAVQALAIFLPAGYWAFKKARAVGGGVGRVLIPAVGCIDNSVEGVAERFT